MVAAASAVASAPSICGAVAAGPASRLTSAGIAPAAAEATAGPRQEGPRQGRTARGQRVVGGTRVVRMAGSVVPDVGRLLEVRRAAAVAGSMACEMDPKGQHMGTWQQGAQVFHKQVRG